MELFFAKTAAGESIKALLRPWAAGGRVRIPTSSCSDEAIQFNDGITTPGVPANKIRTNYQGQKLGAEKSESLDLRLQTIQTL